MHKFLLTILAGFALAACGGGSENTLSGGGTVTPPGGTPPPAIIPTSVTVLASSPQLPSDNSQTVTIQALVRDASNNLLEGTAVFFSADSGVLTVDNTDTTGSGIATATLGTAGDSTNRTITVTALAGDVSGTVTVDVVGTLLFVQGPVNLAQNDVGTFTVSLTDAASNGIGGQVVDISSGSGNTLSATSITTDVNGQGSFDVTAANPGADTLTLTGLGLTATADFSVSGDDFAVTAPVSGTEVDLNVAQAVTATWAVAGTPQVGQTISFSTTRGTLSAATDITDASGNATVSIQSNNAGAGVVTATNPDGTAAAVTLEFVATTPATIEVQSASTNIAPNSQTAISAVVRDATGNLVKNKIVEFQLQDVTGGSLSVGQSTTNSQGLAQTQYTASNTTSATDGVVITAVVQEAPAITDVVTLTVAQRELFISLGTGNEILEPDTTTYAKPYTIFVTDAAGAPVEGVQVQVSILSDRYLKGTSAFADPPGVWVRVPSTPAPCDDEDVNRNGELDAGEDFNGSGRIEAGNVTAVSVVGTGGGTLTTNAQGRGDIEVLYTQDLAGWVEVTLSATAGVEGTEFIESTTFVVTGAASDFNTENVPPPGFDSPFGIAATCLDPT